MILFRKLQSEIHSNKNVHSNEKHNIQFSSNIPLNRKQQSVLKLHHSNIIYGNKARIYWCKHKRNLSWNFYENKGALVVVNHHLKNQICLSQTQTSIAQIVERCQNYGMTESLVSSFAVYTWVNMNIIEQINTFIKFFSSGNGLV